ncbi:hypothetical protein LINGRAHAP2_LOCUS33496 [Linum grandiflorum]
MEAAIGSHHRFHYCNYSTTKPLASSLSVLPFKLCSRTTFFSQGLSIKQSKKLRTGSHQAVQASSSSSSAGSTTTTAATVQERWILAPVGDGDWRHIGFQVQMPGAFEIASNEVTVGRVAEKADLVIPVATVSGVHAKIQKKGGNLVVTDLDSTNGTFIGKSRLKPGLPYTLTSGNFVIFGDVHLAMFRVSKLENVDVAAMSSSDSSSSSSSSAEEEETQETETSVEVEASSS